MADAIANIADGGTGLADVERRSHPRRSGLSTRWALPPNIERAAAAREKKPVAKISAPVEVTPPTIQNPPVVGRRVATYHDFVDVCRDRADELEISRSEIDRIAGLADGHSAHLLAKGFIKIFTPQSLPLILDTLGLRLRVEEDPELTARTLRRRERRDGSHARHLPKFPAIMGAISGIMFGYPHKPPAPTSCAQADRAAVTSNR